MRDGHMRLTGLYTDYEIDRMLEPTHFTPEYGFLAETPDGDYLVMTRRELYDTLPSVELRAPAKAAPGHDFPEMWANAQPLDPDTERTLLDAYEAPIRDGSKLLIQHLKNHHEDESVELPLDVSTRVAYDEPNAADGHHRAGIVISTDDDTYLLKYDHDPEPEPSETVYIDEIPFDYPPVRPSLRPLRKSDVSAENIDAATFDDVYKRAKDDAELLMEGDESLSYDRERTIVTRALGQLMDEGHPLGALYRRPSQPIPAKLYENAREDEDKPAPEWNTDETPSTDEPQQSL